MNIKLYTIDGCYWLGIVHAGKLLLICNKGKCGSRITL